MALPIVRAWSGLDYKFTGSSANEARLAVSHLYEIQSDFRDHFSSYKPEGKIKTERMILQYTSGTGGDSGPKIGILIPLTKLQVCTTSLKVLLSS